jgi:hypothetical protein
MAKKLKDGTEAQPGDLVQSRWSSSGAVWRVVDLYQDKHGRPSANLRSTSSSRVDTRRLRDLNVLIDDEVA